MVVGGHSNDRYSGGERYLWNNETRKREKKEKNHPVLSTPLNYTWRAGVMNAGTVFLFLSYQFTTVIEFEHPGTE